MIAYLWHRLMTWLFGPVAPPVARFTATGPALMGGSVRVPTCECHGTVVCSATRPGDPPAKLFYELAARCAEDGAFESAASYLIEASRRDG